MSPLPRGPKVPAVQALVCALKLLLLDHRPGLPGGHDEGPAQKATRRQPGYRRIRESAP